MRKGVTAAVLTLLLALVAGVAGPRASTRSLRAFAGTGSWVSIYDGAALEHPNRVVATLKTHHIHTLFVETSNDRAARDVAHPLGVGHLLDAAHAAHIEVVGWYLPSFVAPRRDIRRALAGAGFESSHGAHFDAFALDIESTSVHSLTLRSRRAVWVAHDVRAGLPQKMALGAITIDPAGAHYWNGYPFAGLRHSVDVFLPMEYFTDRTSGVRRVAAYSRRNVELVRERAGDVDFPVHPIGGEAHEATLPELRAFLQASKGTIGVSLWEYGETSARQWAALSAARG